MLSEERYSIILDLLNKEQIVKVNTLCDVMNTTRETVRRDLMNLEERNLLKRIRGGAMKVETEDNANASVSVNQYTNFNDRAASQTDLKMYIAREALQFIQENQVIALDSGSTALALAKVLKGRFQNLTVVTNSLAIANELAGAAGINLIVTGGMYKADEKAFISGVAGLLFSKIRVDTFFLTTCGISVEAGITYQRMDEISVQNLMMEASGRTIVIADSSKLGVNSLVRMCGIEDVSALITDYKITREQVESFEQAGVPVVVAPERSE